jgi:hypothetical protein
MDGIDTAKWRKENDESPYYDAGIARLLDALDACRKKEADHWSEKAHGLEEMLSTKEAENAVLRRVFYNIAKHHEEITGEICSVGSYVNQARAELEAERKDGKK